MAPRLSQNKDKWRQTIIMMMKQRAVIRSHQRMCHYSFPKLTTEPTSCAPRLPTHLSFGMDHIQSRIDVIWLKKWSPAQPRNAFFAGGVPPTHALTQPIKRTCTPVKNTMAIPPICFTPFCLDAHTSTCALFSISTRKRLLLDPWWCWYVSQTSWFTHQFDTYTY